MLCAFWKLVHNQALAMPDNPPVTSRQTVEPGIRTKNGKSALAGKTGPLYRHALTRGKNSEKHQVSCRMVSA